MFNTAVLAPGVPRISPSGFGAVRGANVVFTWTNTYTNYQIQLGYDNAGGTAYTVYETLSPGTTTVSHAAGASPFNAPGAISYAVRYISGGYAGPWTANVVKP